MDDQHIRSALIATSYVSKTSTFPGMLYFFYPLPTTTPYLFSKSRTATLVLSILLLFKLYSFYYSAPANPLLRIARSAKRADADHLADELLHSLHTDLFSTPNTTGCSEFAKCQATRRAALRASCPLREEEYSGTHRSQYYYSHDVETCSGDGGSLLELLSFEVPTNQAVEVRSGTRARVLHVDNPLLRVYHYFTSLHGGLGYLYLGEGIVYRFRDTNSSIIWRLYNSYRTRLRLLLGGADKDNAFDNPIGPTFLEFMIYLTEKGSFKPSSWAPTLHSCKACDIRYNSIVSSRRELECVDKSYKDEAATPPATELSYNSKLEVYRNFSELPNWILAELYDTYAADFRVKGC